MCTERSCVPLTHFPLYPNGECCLHFPNSCMLNSSSCAYLPLSLLSSLVKCLFMAVAHFQIGLFCYKQNCLRVILIGVRSL